MKPFAAYRVDEFDFEGYAAKVVIPDTPDEKRHFALKTEYFGIETVVEEGLLERGFHVVFLTNKSRWCLGEDLDRKHRFVKYVTERYTLYPKAAAVGISCGGQIAVKYAAKYPDDVCVLYLDAPVLNYLSCPFHLDGASDRFETEFINATGLTLTDMINYRENPIDFVPTLLAHNLPVILVCGECDKTVPFEQNGKVLFRKYREAHGNIRMIVKAGADHTPHGLPDPTEIVDFIIKHCD